MRDDMDRQEYINTILAQIGSKTVCDEIEKELSAHIDDREQYYLDCGYDRETAARKAMEHMGSPEAAADGFSKVHTKSRRAAVIFAVLSSVFAFLLFWFVSIFDMDDSVMGAGIPEAMFLMFVVGLSVIGKRRNSPVICFVSIIDFVIMYGFYFWFMNVYGDNIYAVCSRIVFKLVCLLTGDFECLSAFWQVGGITVAPYLTYLSVAFYIAIFILLILVFISVWRLKKPTYGLRTKQFTKRVFKAQKAAWFFIAATILILPFFGSFDKDEGMTVKPNTHFNSIIIAQSDTPRPLSEIPTEDILIIDLYYDWGPYVFRLDYNSTSNSKNITYAEYVDTIWGYSIEKECGNKLKYEVKKIDVQCTVNKDYVYIEFVNKYANNSSKNLNDETAYNFVSDKSENWYEVDSIGEISAAVDAYNQVEIIIEKSP